jgi:SAM-dependent methyltransferase
MRMSLWRRRARPVGSVKWGHLRRLTPISRNFGFDRGLPVDRHYVEGFLREHAGDIRGRVLEVGGDDYTRKFGTADHIDVLHVDEEDPVATIVGDLTQPEGLPSSSYDCVICTQTLHLIFDFRTAITSIARLLGPGGVALVTVPGITQTCRYERDVWGDYWRFTSMSIRRLFDEVFAAENVTVDAFGSLPAAIGFLHGLAASELRPEELDTHDPDYEVLLAVRAVKGG